MSASAVATAGLVALWDARPPRLGEPWLLDARRPSPAEGALFLYRQQHLDVPLIACRIASDGVPIVAMVGWQETSEGREIARLERIVGNVARPPRLEDFTAVYWLWRQALAQRGLTSTITQVEKPALRIDRLLTRYGFTRYHEDERWVWYALDL